MTTATPRAWPLREAARCLHAGGLLAYPTEAVYGLGCDPWNPLAVARLRALKARPDAGLILIAADADQLAPLLAPLPAAARRRIEATWPGPVTWVWPATDAAPPWVQAPDGTVAVRVTDHPLAAALCVAFGGPVTSTSANPRGGRPARDPLAVRLRLGGRVDRILHGAVGGRARPTAIRDARDGRLLRPG